LQFGAFDVERVGTFAGHVVQSELSAVVTGLPKDGNDGVWNKFKLKVSYFGKSDPV
jgi:hypothetical protein